MPALVCRAHPLHPPMYCRFNARQHASIRGLFHNGECVTTVGPPRSERHWHSSKSECSLVAEREACDCFGKRYSLRSLRGGTPRRLGPSDPVALHDLLKNSQYAV